MEEQESHYTDDLKANFRSWETGKATEAKANQLFAILIKRHPGEDPKVLNEAARDWVGLEPGGNHYYELKAEEQKLSIKQRAAERKGNKTKARVLKKSKEIVKEARRSYDIPTNNPYTTIVDE